MEATPGSGLSPWAPGGVVYHRGGARREGLEPHHGLAAFGVDCQRLLGAQVWRAGEASAAAERWRLRHGQSQPGRGQSWVPSLPGNEASETRIPVALPTQCLASLAHQPH